MKKIILSMLFMCCIVLTVMPMTVMAEFHCDKCDRWRLATVNYVYVDGQSHRQDLTCRVCGTTYQGITLFSHSGSGTATCTRGIICDECGREYGVLGHIWSNWRSTGNGAHIRTCSRDSSHSETEQCYGGKANCTVVGVMDGLRATRIIMKAL